MYNSKILDTLLLEQGILNIEGLIDPEMAEYVRNSLTILLSKGAPDITLLITSDGGCGSCALDIYDMLRLYPGKVTGKVIAFAGSSAMVILQGCDDRQAAQHARLLVHNGITRDVTFDVIQSKKERTRLRKRMDEQNNRVLAVWEKHSSLSWKKLRALCKKDEDIYAHTAKKLGLIDVVI
jgi:ATP-dependent Clp protease protease subunit